jgi:hypothetical protein
VRSSAAPPDKKLAAAVAFLQPDGWAHKRMHLGG